jgi:hypothetical protein
VTYDGNPAYEKAPSFGSSHHSSVLEISNYFPLKVISTLKTLADFTIKHHFPEIKETDAASYVQLFNP